MTTIEEAVPAKPALTAEELRAQLSEALQQKKAISEILRAICSSPADVESVLGAVAENAARLCDGTDAEIMQVEGDELRLVAKYGRSRQWPIGTVRPINRNWVTGRAVVDGTSVHVHNLQEAEAEFPLGAAFAKQYGHRTNGIIHGHGAQPAACRSAPRPVSPRGASKGQSAPDGFER